MSTREALAYLLSVNRQVHDAAAFARLAVVDAERRSRQACELLRQPVFPFERDETSDRKPSLPQAATLTERGGQ